jgi:hypothetical protein
MRRYELLIAGMLMVGAGAYLLFSTPPALPLWFVWLAGPFLWYMGIAVCIAGIGVALFFNPAKQEKRSAAVEREEEKVAMLRSQPIAVRQPPPAGVLREIPAMGGFIL